MGPEKLFEYLKQSLGEQTLVVFGWVERIKDFNTPVVSITAFDTFTNVNVWSNKIENRDIITQLVLDSLEKVKNDGVSIQGVEITDFEEKGVLQPGRWKVIKNSEPLFRKSIELILS